MPRTTVLVGTTKGAFLLDGTEDRDAWSVAGPFCDGWPINHMAGDSESGALWAAGGNDWCGAGVWRSSDHGASWQLSKLANGQMDAWLADLIEALPRLTHYVTRLRRAQQTAAGGDGRFVASPRVDSLHGTWFELHEDLIRLAGSSRREEVEAGRAG